MTITHHPSEATLLRHSAGNLSEGLSLVVATHLGFCAVCREQLRRFETMGGALLEREPVSILAPDALGRALRQIDTPAAKVMQRPSSPTNAGIGIDLPKPLRAYDIGRWRALGAGLRYCSVGMSRGTSAKVMLLRGAPGAAMPAHGHGDTEFTCVLSGSFSDRTGRYGPGDMGEASSSLDHQPVIGMEGECISLIAIEGKLRMHSFLGRLVSPLLGF